MMTEPEEDYFWSCKCGEEYHATDHIEICRSCGYLLIGWDEEMRLDMMTEPSPDKGTDH